MGSVRASCSYECCPRILSSYFCFPSVSSHCSTPTGITPSRNLEGKPSKPFYQCLELPLRNSDSTMVQPASQMEHQPMVQHAKRQYEDRLDSFGNSKMSSELIKMIKESSRLRLHDSDALSV